MVVGGGGGSVGGVCVSVCVCVAMSVCVCSCVFLSFTPLSSSQTSAIAGKGAKGETVRGRGWKESGNDRAVIR